MFVPRAALSSAASLRSNPRRRQRTNSDDSTKPPSAKRQRSTLREDIESSPESAQHPQLKPGECAPSTLSSHDVALEDNLNLQTNIPIRAAKKADDCKCNSDGTLMLSKTEFYTVTQLPNFPDQVPGSQPGVFTGSFGTGYGYALALAASHAIIWPYVNTSTSSSMTDVFTLPFPTSHTDSNPPTPLGLLLSNAAGAAPGLLVVMPYTGKVIYWETISSGSSLGFARHKQSGIPGSIHGMLSGEHATDIINSEPSGVMVTFSTGRIAHISIRDSQGKPAVIVSFLRSPSGGGRTGLLGSLKNALGGGFWRKNIAALHAGESHQRGQRDVIIATSAGFFEIWDMHWNNGSMPKQQFDVGFHLPEALRHQVVEHANGDDFKILDFAISDSGQTSHDVYNGGPQSWHITVIVARTTTNHRSLFVVQLKLCDGVEIISTNHVELHNLSTHLEPSCVRLFVPSPGDTAFVVIGQSLALFSLNNNEKEVSKHPIGSETRQSIFKDVIPLRSGPGYEILASGYEDQIDGESSAACLLMLRDFGILRITALPRDSKRDTTKDGHITAKHKIEQAIFYGTMTKNPLNLIGNHGLIFPVTEIEQAALEICGELMRSTSKFIPTSGVSVDLNLKLRAKALDDLVFILSQQNQPLRREVWWQLLWGAEKLSAQRAMWKIEDNSRTCKGRTSTLLSHILDSMGKRFKTEVGTADCDLVRHWFLHDTFQMEHIVPWIFNAIKPQKGNHAKAGRKTSEQLLEASELSLAILETAYRYRDENASRYGISDGLLESGVFTSDYNGVPEFWTSYRVGYIETGHLLDLELDSCRAWIQQTTSTPELPESQIVKKLAKNSARQLNILGSMHSERVRWLSAQDDPKLVEEGIATEQTHAKQRKWHLFKLAGIGQLDDAIVLAEKFRDMGALVELIIELQDQTKGSTIHQSSRNGAASADDVSPAEQLSTKISFYFEKFGEPWADAFFSRQISMGQSGILFAMRKFQPYVTRFLRKHPAYSRLGWINDVIGENDYDCAAHVLESLATEHESDIWSHRVQLSLAKLANLASWEESATPDSLIVRDNVRRLEDLAETDVVQEVIFAYMKPALQSAIDPKAAIDIAAESFTKLTAEDRPSLHEIFVEGVSRIVSRQVVGLDELIDLLTLIDLTLVTGHGQDEIVGKQFYLALRVIRLASQAQGQHRNIALQKLVWRRCMIDNNWRQLGETAEEKEADFNSLLYDTSLFRTLNWCFRDGRDEDSSYPSIYIPDSPHDLLLSESESEYLTSRFHPEQRIRVHHDLVRESEMLHQQINNGKLEFWFKSFVDSAKAATHETPLVVNDKDNAQHCTQLLEAPTDKVQLSWL
ncbi:hypothetical protein BO70DRAFT_367056 [Aspergillus heteromorphus CBS 117.55]|uniref:Nuclear pore complex subunit Nup133 n=1 Tax=Aspergillus heteromorphus CBS 117.55 TaxID=1448321 RepID=A0A317URJ2_9EURO|nr:uncharacterized protein BO70DRAFT_367056 [Aspergillus heteromorphus CBS 117.55]PWY64245.1 hypothetical protein BO70DRAFT_367056 [Aspergillus heteromorphus CBS 117.55]